MESGPVEVVHTHPFTVCIHRASVGAGGVAKYGVLQDDNV